MDNQPVLCSVDMDTIQPVATADLGHLHYGRYNRRTNLYGHCSRNDHNTPQFPSSYLIWIHGPNTSNARPVPSTGYRPSIHILRHFSTSSGVAGLNASGARFRSTTTRLPIPLLDQLLHEHLALRCAGCLVRRATQHQAEGCQYHLRCAASHRIRHPLDTGSMRLTDPTGICASMEKVR